MNRKTIANELSARELFLCTINDHRIYSTSTQYVLDNLRKKYCAGKYDKTRAVIAFEVVATRMAKLYTRQYAVSGTKYYTLFNAATRRMCAELLEEYYFEQLTEDHHGRMGS